MHLLVCVYLKIECEEKGTRKELGKAYYIIIQTPARQEVMTCSMQSAERAMVCVLK